MDVDLAVAGDKDPLGDDDEVVTYVEPGRQVYKKVIVRDGRVKGAILLGDGASVPRILQAFDREEMLPDNRAELLFPLAGGEGPAGGVDVAELPDTARICDCNGVSKGRIMAAADAGQRDMAAVCAITRAGSGCGGCRAQVQAVLDAMGGGPAETAAGGDNGMAAAAVYGAGGGKGGSGARAAARRPGGGIAATRAGELRPVG